MVVFQDIAEHLTTVHLNRCERGKRCLYEGSTPPRGFPNTWVSFFEPLIIVQDLLPLNFDLD